MSNAKGDSQHSIGSGQEQSTIEARFQEERPQLLSLPPRPYSVSKLFSALVHSYQTTRIEGNWYSVPSGYVGLKLDIHLECWEARFFYQGQLVSIHPRCLEKGEWILNPLHYLEVLKTKTGAFEEARPLKQWRSRWPVAYERCLEKLRDRLGYVKGTQEFLGVLQLHETYSSEEVEAAVVLATECHTWNLASIRHLLEVQDHEVTIDPLPQHRLPPGTTTDFAPPNLDLYNQLLN